MAVGRITGPLLASNLRRDGVNIAFETNLLYIDVVNGRIGIRQSTPLYELDVTTGTIRAAKLIVNTATIGLVTITSTTSSSTMSTTYGPISLVPGGNDQINLNANTFVRGDLHATGDITADGNIRLGDTTGTDTLIIDAEIQSDLLPFISTGTIEFVSTGSTATIFVTNTNIVSDYSIGSTTSYWKSAYLENIFTRQIDTAGTATDIQFFPDIPLLERTLNKSVTMNGDIRVYGGSPIGTFPVVNNILYVNENGNDDNDGRAMDSSRACRTITGATRSPYFKQGTVIKVAPGTYYEDNPIKLLPYTSVVGDSLRAVFVFPLNNTVDLFHVNSGVYITGMTMRDLRRGEVTRYAPGGSGTYTTGAYCVAFPPNLNNPIDVFHSPYIQNCTNQSGPWLYDGTMFLPNQIVQIPQVVGTSTYLANTTSLLVTILPEITSNQLEVGMAVNGKGITINVDLPVATIESIENPIQGYRSAKSLLSANKNFIKDEVISYIYNQFPSFTFNEVTCRRDTGYIIDALINDAILGGNEKIVNAGRAYYQGNVQILGNETVPTIAAFRRIKEVAINIVSNTTVTPSPGNSTPQIINTATTGGAIAIENISNLTELLVDILENNSGYENAAALLNANRGFIQAETVAFVNKTYVGEPIPSFTYNRSKCFRDVGYIIDAIADDLLYGGNQQSVAAGVAYWNGNTSLIPGEVDETIAGFTYLASIVRDVVLQNEFKDGYQNTVTQITNLTTGSNAAIELVARNVGVINGILKSGANSAPTIINNRLIPSTIPGVVDSYNLIIANKNFIQHEVVNYIDVTFTNLDFIYNESKCGRDTGLILDGLILDLVYNSNSQSTFAGLQYWNQGNSAIPGEETTTTNAFAYAKTVCQNLLTATTVTSIVSPILGEKFDVFLNILNSGTNGVTDLITPLRDTTSSQAVIISVDLLQTNKTSIANNVISWIENNKTPGFTYDSTKCRRDIGYVLDSICMDMLRAGNRQSIQAGVYYFGYNSSSTVLINEMPQTIAAYKFMKTLIDKVVQRITVTNTYQNTVDQNTDLIGASTDESQKIAKNLDLIRDIIKKGPSAAPAQVPLPLTANTSTNITRAYDILKTNRDFIVAEVVEFVNTTFINPYVFNYNESKCFRDVGYIVDAIANDIIRRSNVNSLNAGLNYWDGAVSVIEGQLKETAGAIQYAKTIALDVISNNPVTSFYQESVEYIIPGTTTTTSTSVVKQNINPQLPNGILARDLVDSNFNAITTIIQNGPAYAPPSTNSTLTQFIVNLSTSTYRAAFEDTLYFGETTVYPVVESTFFLGEWGPNGFADRRIDPYGSGGGALVDGNAPSRRSPIQSFVFDAFTQITQGGRGIHIINEGYAQLVSVFTIFCNVAVETASGGIASITNSNNNFGDLCLLSTGYGPRKFGGTVYNPANIAYNPVTNGFEPNEYYPQGYFPTSQQICVFVPDPNNRPHISLVMEVLPPDEYVNYDGITVPYVNEVGYPGFLTANVNTSSLTTGSYTINAVDVTGVAVGQTVHVRDQFGYEADDNGAGQRYISTGTVITDVTYSTITLSKPILQGGGQYNNPNYFNVYCCGNAYYNVLTSKTATSPYPTGQSKILGQEIETIDAVNYLRDVAIKISNNEIVDAKNNRSQQIIDNMLDGSGADAFIENRLGIITGVILSGPQAAPEVVTTGTLLTNRAATINLLNLNKIFLQNEILAYTDQIFGGFTYDETKCVRDTKLIIDSIALDMLYPSQYNSQSTFAGLQYWNQSSSSIPGEQTTTTNAINYAKNLAVSYAQSAGGSVPASIVNSRFNEVTSIITNGTAGITDLIQSNGLPTADSNKLAAYNSILSNKASIISATISNINSTNPGFSYNQTTCQRDLGYIIDSVVFDLKHGGNRQSIQSGVYYYNYSTTSTAIPNEIPETIAAYNFIKAIVGDIVTGTPISPKYQNIVSQVTNLTPATEIDTGALQSKVDIITDIIKNGPSVVVEQTPISLTQSTSTTAINAYTLLLANKDFIAAEVIAYIANEFGGFTYNKQKCRRDVGLMVDALVADLSTGGNFRSVEAAKTYYSKDGTYHIVTLEDNVRNPLLFIDGSTINFYQRSYQSASGYLFEYCGAGTNYGALPQVGRVDPNQTKEVVQLNNGKVFFTSTDQNGDFRIGPTLVISQATGVLSGRTFEKSLFAQMTPFILAVEAGGGE